MSTIDVTKLVRDVQESTMQQAFYLQSKAFFEKNNEHINEIARLKAEVAYLKGEEHPYSDLGSMMPKYLLEHWINENARLKAEVERLKDTKAVVYADRERLLAEVERLRKAGDAICAAYELGDDFLSPIQAWNAAKEGKQS